MLGFRERQHIKLLYCSKRHFQWVYIEELLFEIENSLTFLQQVPSLRTVSTQ